MRCAEAFGDEGTADLGRGEAAHIRGAVYERQLEFASVRRCARSALAALGVPPTDILPGTLGAPLWPKGVVGSMTHCAGYRAAVVASCSQVRAVGIDAEVNEPLPDDIIDVVASPQEQLQLGRRLGTRLAWDRLLFSAKEAVYKAWFPLTGQFLEFDDVHIRFTLLGYFNATLSVSVPADQAALSDVLVGRWMASESFLATLVVVDPPR